MKKREKFASFLIMLGQEERQIEIIREVLVEQDSFCFDTLFRRLNHTNKNGLITVDEIQQFLLDSGISSNVNEAKFLSKYLIKCFDNDKDGKISYWDLMANLYPIKKVNMILKKYSTKERRVSPPNVNIESYLDYNGEITAEEFSLWPEKLDPGLEYGLRRFIGRELKFYRRVCLFNQKFNNNLKKESKDSIKGKIDFSELFADLIQSKNCEDENPKSFNQKLSAKDIKSYIIDVTKDKIICDNNLIKSIMRRLDRDQDGLVSLNDYTCAIQPLEADQNFLRDTVNKLICKVKLDENTLFQKKMDKNFYEVEQAKNIAKKISSIGRPSKAKTDINDNKKLDYKDHKNINENEDDSKSIALTWSQLLKSGK